MFSRGDGKQFCWNYRFLGFYYSQKVVLLPVGASEM
ncbi:hypothetical protein OIU77_006640 [Salix suchowensis]|uniref:Uncharacterized protein n=1 Tax=Salix suchowensis TaxID=1278906 RepID=A0ABQ9AMH8_9ROSI|nr:hypothetical protein OIU77_006640 [Salix suchowensis]